MFAYAAQVEPAGEPLHYGSTEAAGRRWTVATYERVNRDKMATSAVLLIDRGRIIDRYDGQWMSGHVEQRD
jgi:hypothetical protein